MRLAKVSAYSLTLIILQFALLVALFSSLIPIEHIDVMSIVGILCIASALGLAIWAKRSMHATHFSIFPEPVDEGTLVTEGPYRFVRHPMYSALLLAGSGVVVTDFSLYRCLLFLGLLLVLVVKIRREEQLLISAYPAYADYRKTSHALIPGVI